MDPCLAHPYHWFGITLAGRLFLAVNRAGLQCLGFSRFLVSCAMGSNDRLPEAVHNVLLNADRFFTHLLTNPTVDVTGFSAVRLRLMGFPSSLALVLKRFT